MFRAEAKGITKKFSDNSQALDKDELAIYRQGILEKAVYWRNATITFLNKSKSLFPLWRDSCTNPIDETHDYSGGIYI